MAKKKYVVKAGDNLLKLAEKYGVSIQEIQQENGINSLTPGQTIRVPVQKTKGRAWVTGEDERKTTTVNGQQIRLGPNSYVAPQTGGGFLDQLNNFLFPQQNSSQINGTRGSVSPGKGINGLASPVAANGVGGVGSSVGANTNGDISGSIPTFARQPAITTQGSLSPDKQGFVPPMSGQFSYAPQGQNNSYQPYRVPAPVNNFTQPAFTTANGVYKDPRTGVSPNAIAMANARYYGFMPALQPAPQPVVQPAQSNYGNYAAGNKLYSGQAKTAQESFQQGNKKGVKKRWWIGRGKTHGENTAKVVAPQPIIQGNDIQQGTWRV